MMPSKNTVSKKLPCRYCCKAILPATFRYTGGYCIFCAQNEDLTHDIKPDQWHQTAQNLLSHINIEVDEIRFSCYSTVWPLKIKVSKTICTDVNESSSAS